MIGSYVVHDTGHMLKVEGIFVCQVCTRSSASALEPPSAGLPCHVHVVSSCFEATDDPMTPRFPIHRGRPEPSHTAGPNATSRPRYDSRARPSCHWEKRRGFMDRGFGDTDLARRRKPGTPFITRDIGIEDDRAAPASAGRGRSSHSLFDLKKAYD